MTIPAIKQQHLATITAQERKQLGRIRPTGRAPDAPDEAPSRNASGGDAPSSRSRAGADATAQRTITALTIGLILLAGIATIPVVRAISGTLVETFDDDTVGSNPSSTDPAWYSYSETGSGTQTVGVIGSQSVSPSNSLLINNHASSQTLFKNPIFSITSANRPTPGLNMCDATTAQAPYTIEYSFRISALPVGSTYLMGFLPGSGDVRDTQHFLGMAITTGGSVQAIITGSSSNTAITVPDLTVAVDTWYRVQLSQIRCTTSEHITIFFPDLGTGTEAGPISGTMAGTNTFIVIPNVAPCTCPDVWIDDFKLIGATVPDDPNVIFCSAPTEGNFGYDYVEQVVYDDSLDNGIGGLDDGFVFSGDSTDSHYLAKAFPDGTKALSTRAGIESQIADAGESSIFWIAYTTGVATLSQGATGDGGGDMTAAGDGDDSGNFANHIQARFVETGDDWHITIQYNLAGAGRTQISSSVSHGNPDNPTLYIFEVNTGSTALDPHPMIGVASSYDGFPALPARTARVLLDDGSILMTRDLPAGLYDFVWKDQWFVSKGDSALSDSETFLDENEAAANDNESTCIYDLTGTANPSECYGSCGTAPASTQPSETTTSTSTSGGGGFANSPPWLWPTVFTFLGAMVIAAILALLVGKAEGILFGLLGFTALIISIVAWGMPLYIPLLFLILPAIAITIWKGPWSN